jgi:hypothetical protein
MRHGERKVIRVDTRSGFERAEKVSAAQQLAHKGFRCPSATAPPSSLARAIDIRGLQGPTTVRVIEGFFVGFFDPPGALIRLNQR